MCLLRIGLLLGGHFLLLISFAPAFAFACNVYHYTPSIVGSYKLHSFTIHILVHVHKVRPIPGPYTFSRRTSGP